MAEAFLDDAPVHTSASNISIPINNSKFWHNFQNESTDKWMQALGAYDQTQVRVKQQVVTVECSAIGPNHYLQYKLSSDR